MTCRSRSAEGGQPNRSALATPPFPAPRPRAGREESEGWEPRVCTHTHSHEHTHTLPRHTQVRTSTPDNYAIKHVRNAQTCWHAYTHTHMGVNYSQASQSHTGSFSHILDTFAHTYKLVHITSQLHTPTPDILIVTQPHQSSITPKLIAQPEKLSCIGHCIHPLHSVVLSARWCPAHCGCWGWLCAQNTSSPAL